MSVDKIDFYFSKAETHFKNSILEFSLTYRHVDWGRINDESCENFETHNTLLYYNWIC